VAKELAEDGMAESLAGWLESWLVGELAGWRAGWLESWLVGELTRELSSRES